MAVPQEVIDALSAAGRPVVIGHINPDIDAMGAMLGLSRALPGEAAVTFGNRPLGPRPAAMLRWADCRPADAQRVRQADLAVVVDTANVGRINVQGGWETLADLRVINIDHHVSNERFGRHNWVEPGTSSTCELICRLIIAAGWPLDPTTATLLYAGIHADTCGFSLPTSAEAFEAAVALVRAGAKPAAVGQSLWRSQRPHEFALLRTVYQNTRTTPDGGIAYSSLSLAEIEAAGCTPADVDDQVAIPRSLAGIRMAALLSEAEPGVVRINLRGEEGTPVLPLAAQLGGGGHPYSAGVRMRGPLTEVVERFLGHATEYLHSRPGEHGKGATP